LLNNASERITGYRRDQITTIDQWFARIHDDDPLAARALYELDRAAGFPAPRELAIRRSDGQACLVEFAGYAQSHSEVWLIHDITERKQIEQELKQTLAEQKAILENSVIGIAIIKQRSVLRANTGMERLLGYAPGEMTGLSTRHWYCSDDDYDAIGAGILHATQSGDIFSQDIQLMRKDCSKVWCSLHAKAKDPGIPDSSGVCVLQDISARKDAEQMLNEMNRTLELAVADLRQAQGQLIHSEKMAALGQLVAGVAHEINTPIGAVKSSGKNIADSLDQALDHMPALFRLLEPDAIALFMRLIGHRSEKTSMLSTREERVIARELESRLEQAGIEHARQRASILVQLHAHDSHADYLPLLRHPECELILNTAYSIVTIATNTANINVAVERVTKIIFALKSFSRIDLDGEMVDADLREGIETVLTIYQNQIKQHTELVRHYEEIAPLRCLPDELNQVWTNLIHNALQAMAYRGTLTIRVGREGNEAVVAIGDTGCGIEPAIRERIFDAFFTTKAAGEGSGLGLDIVRKIIEKHGGRIDLDSTVGVGSTFRVYLPYQLEEV
jgi:PAS domain S-box-containing protein